MNLKFATRAQYVIDPVIIDGFTRSGKFLLGHLIGALEGLECMQNPMLLEASLYLVRLKKLEIETARILVQTDIDMHSYDMAIGRNLNTRLDDASSVYKKADYERFLARADENDADSLISRYCQEGFLPLYIGHECMCNANILFDIYPSARLVNIQRDPVALIMSWYRRGWGKRFGVDPKSVSIAFQSERGPVPWFAINWSPSYSEIGEMDRIIMSLEAISSYAKKEYQSLNSKQRSQVHLISFDAILANPNDVINSVSKFIGRTPQKNILEILTRERVTRIVSEDERKILLNEIKSLMSPNMGPRLQALIDDFDSYWLSLVKNNK